MPPHELDALLRFFREGGVANLRALLRRLARHAGVALDVAEPTPVPRMCGYWPGEAEFAWQAEHGITSFGMHDVRDLGSLARPDQFGFVGLFE